MVEATCAKVFEVTSAKNKYLHTWYKDRRSNEESNNAHITTNHQSSNPEQDSAPSEKLPLSNPHLHDDVADGMKEDVGDNSMRPQHQKLVTDEEEK